MKIIGNGNCWERKGKPKNKKEKKIAEYVEGLPVSSWLRAGLGLIGKNPGLTKSEYNLIKRWIDQSRQNKKVDL